MKDMKIKTDIDTLSEAWIMLDDIGLSGMLVNKPVQIDVKELLQNLLRKKRIQEFVALVTGMSKEEAGALELPQVNEVITGFFIGIGTGLASLSGLGLLVAQTAKPEDVTKAE